MRRGHGAEVPGDIERREEQEEMGEEGREEMLG